MIDWKGSSIPILHILKSVSKLTVFKVDPLKTDLPSVTQEDMSKQMRTVLKKILTSSFKSYEN